MESGLVEPALVDVDDASALLQQIKNSQSILLPEDEAPRSIALNGHGLRQPVPHRQILPHNVANQIQRHFQLCFLLDYLLDLLSSHNLLIGLESCCDSIFNCYPFPFFKVFFVSPCLELPRIVVRLLHQNADEPSRDSELLRNVFMV